jgi:WD40 repeat protein
MKKIYFSLLLTLTATLPFQLFGQDSLNNLKTILREHSDDVECIAYSPSGKFIATGGWDNTIRVFKVDSTIEWWGTLYGHGAAVTCLTFSKDNKKLLSGGKDARVIFWEMDTFLNFEKKFEYKPHASGITALLIDPGMRTIYTAGNDGRFVIYDIAKKTEKRFDNKIPINAMALSTDKRFLFIADNSTTLKQYDMKGTLIKSFVGHSDFLTSVVYAINNKYIITGSLDKTAIVWDLAKAKPIRTIKGHDWNVTSLSLSTDGKYLVTGSTDGTSRLWDAETGTLIQAFSGIGNNVRCVAISPDCQQIGSASYEESSIEQGYGAVIWNSGIQIAKKAVGTTPGAKKPPAKSGPAPTGKTTAKPVAVPVSDSKKVIKKTEEVEISIEENQK